MRRALLVSMVGIGLACGGGDGATQDAAQPSEPAQHEENRPPYVEAISIAPPRPSAEDALSVALRVVDPDRDPLDVDLTWYRNGVAFDHSGRQSIDPGVFRRGDRVWIEGVVSDGQAQVEVKSEPVTIADAPPRVSSIRITPPEPSAADMLEAEVTGADADGDDVTWSYRWLVDGHPLEGASGTRIPPGTLKRGARVSLEVSGNDGTQDGEWTASAPVVIGNAKPKVTSQPVYGLASPGHYVYEVKAEDADGDQPLRFELAEGPPGMSIDPASGVLSWTLPADAKGSYPVEIGVSDAHGGRASQRYALQISWEAEPPPTPASAHDSDDAGAAEQPASAETPRASSGKPSSQGAAAQPSDDDEEREDDGDF